ncbi:PDZ domain-containing protein, partial [bacterium]|nr:PDZ domain-containing protein [bacterium]
MKILKKILLISLTFSIFTNALASSDKLSGDQIYDYFDMFVHEIPDDKFLNDKDITYREFLNYFYSSFNTKNPKYTVRKMYKLVKQINYKSDDTKLLYFAIKNNLISVQNKKFNLDNLIDEVDIKKFQSFLLNQNFKRSEEEKSNDAIDYYENFLLDVFNTINDKYYFKDDISKQDLLYGAINGMVESLNDPHSSFQTPEEKKNFLDSLNQELEGIGASMMLNKNKQFQIITPLKGSPALKSGLLPGDIVISVNGIDLSGKTIQDGISLIKGPKGTKVKLTIKRGSKFLDFYITREKIDIPIVSGSIIDNKNLIIDIRSFGSETFSKVQDILEKNNSNDIKNIIIDLRSNPGGYLNSAILIADLFLSENQEIVSTVKSNGSINSILAS